MAKRMRKVSIKPVGKAIDRAIAQLKAIRATATPAGKKRIDLRIRQLRQSRASVRIVCQGSWNIVE